MTNAVKVFQSTEFGDVRVTVKNGEPWFVTRDACRVLGLSNVTEATRGLDGDELSSVVLNSGGQNREMTTVSESGLYSLIFRSRKPEAKKFRKWVTSVVLPAIRKDGGYIAGEENIDKMDELAQTELTLKVMTMLNNKVGRLQQSLDKATAIIDEHLNFVTVDELRALKHTYLSPDMSRLLGITASKLARERGIELKKQERKLVRRGKKISSFVNVYPAYLLDEAASMIGLGYLVAA